MTPAPPERAPATSRSVGLADVPAILLIVLCTLSLVSRVLLLLGR